MPRLTAATIGELVLRGAHGWQDREAFVLPDERVTYAELLQRSEAAARSLAALGVRGGDKVGLLLPNGIEFLAALFGAQLLGAIAVPINTRFRGEEIAYVLASAEIRVLVIGDFEGVPLDYLGRLDEALPELHNAEDPHSLELTATPNLRTVVLLGGRSRPGLLDEDAFGALASRAAPEGVGNGGLLGKSDDVALILFTSGTTSRPKGCLLTHAGVLYSWRQVARRFDFGSGDRIFDPLPLFHLGGLGPTLAALDIGATVLSMRHFEPARALEMIERERATWIYTMFPPVTMELIKHPSFAERNFDSVRAIANVGPRETLDLISRSFAPVPHLQGQFGMTEGSGSMTANYLSDSPEDRIATSGKPLDGTEFAVIDIDTGRRLGTGERGELTFRGPGVFRGYYADSIATADALDADGWVHSGDLGEMTEDGRIIYHGRVKEMLKVGGENVAPAEIESHIATLAAVSQVHVVPAPDERLDEVPAAFIELVPGLTLTAEDVVVHCRESIASFKVPRYVRFVTEWPMSATKVQKATLRANIKTEIEAGISGEGSDR